MQTIIAPSRLKWRLSSGNGSSHRDHHGAGMKTTTTTTTMKVLTPEHPHHPHPHPHHCQHHQDDGVEAKLAYTACLDALKTLMEYLRREMGIQLPVRPGEENLLVILQRAHDYCYQMDQHHGTTLLLLLSCWKSVSTYTAVAHGQSWRQFQHSKHFATTTSTSTAETSTNTNSNTTSSTAAAGGEKKNNQKLHDHHYLPNKNGTRLYQALQKTIRYAEDCSTCQRQVYLLQRKLLCCQDDDQIKILPQPPPPPLPPPEEEEEEEEENDDDDDVGR
jgi:hypothetical protein